MKVVVGVVGVLVALAVLVFGLYFDFSWFLVGGFKQAVHAVNDNASNLAVFWGLLRLACAGVATVVAGGLAFVIGAVSLNYAVS